MRIEAEDHAVMNDLEKLIIEYPFQARENNEFWQAANAYFERSPMNLMGDWLESSLPTESNT